MPDRADDPPPHPRPYVPDYARRPAPFVGKTPRRKFSDGPVLGWVAILAFLGFIFWGAATQSHPAHPVYTTETGHAYHRAGCEWLHTQFETTREIARQDGFTPCKICRPDDGDPDENDQGSTDPYH